MKDSEVNDETLSGYLSYLFGRGKTAAYAKIAIVAARWRCASEDKDDPRGKRCRNAIANFRRQGIGRGFGQVDGLTFEDAEKMLDLAAGEKTAFGWRDAAVIAVMSDSLLRVSECAAIDVEHPDFKGNTLFIPKSKTDQEGKGAMGYLGPRTLEHVRVWMEKAKITERRLPCRDSTRRPVDFPQYARPLLKESRRLTRGNGQTLGQTSEASPASPDPGTLTPHRRRPRGLHGWPAGERPPTDRPDTPHNRRGCPRIDDCRLPLLGSGEGVGGVHGAARRTRGRTPGWTLTAPLKVRPRRQGRPNFPLDEKSEIC